MIHADQSYPHVEILNKGYTERVSDCEISELSNTSVQVQITTFTMAT